MRPFTVIVPLLLLWLLFGWLVHADNDTTATVATSASSTIPPPPPPPAATDDLPEELNHKLRMVSQAISEGTSAKLEEARKAHKQQEEEESNRMLHLRNEREKEEAEDAANVAFCRQRLDDAEKRSADLKPLDENTSLENLLHAKPLLLDKGSHSVDYTTPLISKVTWLLAIAGATYGIATLIYTYVQQQQNRRQHPQTTPHPAFIPPSSATTSHQQQQKQQKQQQQQHSTTATTSAITTTKSSARTTEKLGVGGGGVGVGRGTSAATTVKVEANDSLEEEGDDSWLDEVDSEEEN